MKLLGISGSLMKSARTRTAVQFTLDAARRLFPGLEVELLDLRDWKVSLMDGRSLTEYPDDTVRAVDKVQQADCVVIGSPIYRATYTGALKNFLDHLPLEALMGKVVGLIATGATPHHYLAIDHELRTVMAWFNAYSLPGSVYVENSHFRDEALADERVRAHLEQLAGSVVLTAEKLRGVPAEPPPLAAWARG